MTLIRPGAINAKIANQLGSCVLASMRSRSSAGYVAIRPDGRRRLNATAGGAANGDRRPGPDAERHDPDQDGRSTATQGIRLGLDAPRLGHRAHKPLPLVEYVNNETLPCCFRNRDAGAWQHIPAGARQGGQQWRAGRTSVRCGPRSPVFAAWLVQLRGPVCVRWRSFTNFYFDVGKRPSWRHLLIRDDPTGAFEPHNARRQISGRYRWRRPTAPTR